MPPFIQTRKDKLHITLWVSGTDLPQRVVLRYEKDNEETSLQMTRQKAAPESGVVAWRGVIDLSEGQPRRRYSFKLLWLDKQRWLTPQGLSSIPPARLEQFAVESSG
ncbi:alpha amylase N-terminal ig-like domain-containing protein [Buttiauxella agrestis]